MEFEFPETKTEQVCYCVSRDSLAPALGANQVPDLTFFDASDDD